MSYVDQVSELKDRVAAELRAIPGVTGVGVGYKYIGGVRTNIVGVTVSVAEKKETKDLPSEEIIPSVIDGVFVDVMPGRWKSAAAIAGAARIITSVVTGTMGVAISKTVGITCWHVVQPGGIGSPVGDAASLANIGNVLSGGITSTADEAAFSINPPFTGIVGYISLIGYTKGKRAAVLGEHVRKNGERTGYTTGVVTHINYEFIRDDVDHFFNQTVIEGDGRPFIDHGDSGAMVVGNDNMVIGMVTSTSELLGANHGIASLISYAIPNVADPIDSGQVVTANTAAKMNSMANDLVYGGSINSAGHLILSTKDSRTFDAGVISNFDQNLINAFGLILAPEHMGRTLRCKADGGTFLVRIPLLTTPTLPIGASVAFKQEGVGSVLIEPLGAGVVIDYPDEIYCGTREQNSVLSLYHEALNKWLVYGDYKPFV